MSQYGSGKCSICGSPGTSKLTCPLNPDAKNPNPSKHPLAKKMSSSKQKTSSAKSKVKSVLPKDSKLLQLKGPGSMPKPSVKSKMLTKRIKPVLPKSTFMKSMSILDNRNRERNPVEHSRRMTALDTIDSLMSLPQDVGDKIFKYSAHNVYSWDPTREPVYEKKLIVPVKYVNNSEKQITKIERGEYAYFIVPEWKFTLVYSDYVTWYNTYSKALNHIQNYTGYGQDPDLDDRFGMTMLYVYFFDTNEFIELGETKKINGKYIIEIDSSILKTLDGNNFKGDEIYGIFDEDLDDDVVFRTKQNEDAIVIKVY